MMRRGVGYCGNYDCDEWNRGVFLLGANAPEHCPCCRRESTWTLVWETSHVEGQMPARMVRVEFNYDATELRFRDIAIVIDESLSEGGVMTLRTPCIRTEKRALVIAEQWLGKLQLRGANGVLTKRTPEVVLRMDDPAYYEEMCMWADKLADSHLVEKSQ